MAREESRYLASAGEEAKKYLRELKEYKTKEEKKAFGLAYKIRIRDMKRKAAKLEGRERELTEKAIHRLVFKTVLINVFNR